MAKHLTNNQSVLLLVNDDNVFQSEEVNEMETKVGKNNVSTIQLNNCMLFL